MDIPKIKNAVRDILEAIGENPDREGLKETPRRVAELYSEVFSGLQEDPKKHLDVTYSIQQDEMILIKDIPLYAMCEHHLLPFIGKAHIAYLPDKKVVGLSKIVRVVESFAKRPQLQERMTTEIADCIMEQLKPKGAMVVIKAEHLCISLRGVQKPGTQTITSAIRGRFKSDERTKIEAFSLINGHG